MTALSFGRSGRWFGLAALALVAALSVSADSLVFAADAGNLTSIEGVEDSTSYIIGPQNVLQIKIFGDAATNQIYRVDERGFIKHALLGSVEVGGSSVAAAEKRIQSELAAGYFVDPRVTIFILEHSRFSVLGEVRKPGTFEILGRTSFIEAISMAGGFTPVANQKAVKIIRKNGGGESVVEVDAAKIMEHGDSAANISIQADDVVAVAKSFF